MKFYQAHSGHVVIILSGVKIWELTNQKILGVKIWNLPIKTKYDTNSVMGTDQTQKVENCHIILCYNLFLSV